MQRRKGTAHASPQNAPSPAKLRAAHPGDLFRLMYTSGTTDRPKGVMHTYSNFYWKSSAHVIALGLAPTDRLLVAGPLYHVGAFDLPGMAVLWVGGTLSILRDFTAAHAVAAIARERLTGAWLAPVMLGAILAEASCGANDLDSVRWVVVGGGERTPEARIKAFYDRFTRARYVDAYGLTETCSGDTMMEAGRELEKIGSVGRALAHVELEIRGPDGQPLAPGDTGEICLRGPKVTPGYWRDAENTKAAFFDDWLRTGDVGHLDAEGFLTVTDRKKDMIISGGENIYPAELEAVLEACPGIAEAAVVARADPRWGEVPVAVVVRRPGAAVSAEDVNALFQGRLARFKHPRDVVFADALPRNAMGKVLRYQLRERYGRK